MPDSPFRRQLAGTGGSGRRSPFAARLSAPEPRGESAETYVGAAGSGFNEGLAQVLGLPVDLVTRAIRMIPGAGEVMPAHAAGGSESIRTALNEIGILTGDAAYRDALGREPTTGEAMTARVAEEVGATAPFAAAPLAVARAGRAAPRPPGRGSAAGNAARAIVETASRAPGRTTAAEAGLGASAGAGAAVAQQAAPGDPSAETLGTLAGGLSPAVAARGPAGMAARLASRVVRHNAPEAVRRRAEREVADTIRAEVTPADRAALEEAARLRRDMPGFDPTLAEATGSPSLGAAQRRIESEASGPALNALAARHAGNAEALRRFAADAAPPGPDNPMLVIDVAKRRGETLMGRVDAALEEVSARRAAAADALPAVDRADRGRAIRDAIEAARKDARAAMSARAEELGINNADASVEFRTLAENMKELGTARSVFEDTHNLPEVLRQLERMAAAKKGKSRKVSFRDLKALRERVGDDLRDAAAAANPSQKKIRMLATLRSQIDEAIDAVAKDADPALAGNYATFRDEYFRTVIQPFERGVMFKVRAKDRRRVYRTPDERVAEAFFGPGRQSAARQYQRVFGSNPEALDALADVALDSYRQAAVRDGVINPRLAETWVRRHQAVLDEFPRFAARIQEAGGLNDALLQRQAQLEARRKAVEDSILMRRMRPVDLGVQTPGQAILHALRTPRVMNTLLRSVRGDEAAMAALRRHVWDAAADLPADELASFTAEHRRALSRIFPPRHMANLDRIQRARTMIERVPPPQGRAAAGESGVTRLGKRLGTGVPQAQSRLFAATSGRTSYRYIAGDMLARFFQRRSEVQRQALFREALYNPEVAEDLAAMVGPGDPRVYGFRARRLNAWLFNIGIDSETAEDDPPALRMPAKPTPAVLPTDGTPYRGGG